MCASEFQIGYLTADEPGIGGIVRAHAADFRVLEIPLYGPSGRGQHTMFEIEKRGLSTPEAIQHLARAWHISPRQIGMAGLKDARAVTRQILTVEGIPPEVVLAYRFPTPQSPDEPALRVLWAERHHNRLKIGHLKGNRFTIRIRGVSLEALPQAGRILEILRRRGVPNGFGPQRFGQRHTSHLLGQSIVRGDLAAFYHFLLGGPQPGDREDVLRARQSFDEGDLPSALRLWPRSVQPEYRVLAALAEGISPQQIFRRFPRHLKRLYISAYQSHLFNRLLAARLPKLDDIQEGDLAIKHENGAFFLVQDAKQERPRVARLEISASGPLYGPKVRLAQSKPGEAERRLLIEEGLLLEDWRIGGVRLPGGRRPFRVPISEIDVTYNEGLVLHFNLPAGAYASNVISEIVKSRAPIGLES